MFAVFATLALFLAASARVSEVSTARALLTNKRGRKDRCYDYGYECHKDDDCCGCLECHYGYCSQPCVRKGGYCDIYNYCCEVRGFIFKWVGLLFRFLFPRIWVSLIARARPCLCCS